LVDRQRRRGRSGVPHRSLPSHLDGGCSIRSPHARSDAALRGPKAMKILERRVYRGPSLYAHFPVMRITLDLGELEAWPSAKIVGFNDRLLSALPTLHEHTCSYETPGGFVRRLTEDEGTWLGHVFEHTAIELQQLSGAKVSFGKTRSVT